MPTAEKTSLKCRSVFGPPREPSSVARGDADESVCAAQTESAENNVESCSAGTTCEPAATEESFSNLFYRNIIQIMLMWA